MARQYNLMSSDGHLEVPPERWTHRVPQKYRDRAPHTVRLPDGGDALMIEKVEILENEKPVAVDQHLAPAGPGYDNNEFRLNISTVDPSAKYSLRAWVHGLGGNDSDGYVTVSPPR